MARVDDFALFLILWEKYAVFTTHYDFSYKVFKGDLCYIKEISSLQDFYFLIYGNGQYYTELHWFMNLKKILDPCDKFHLVWIINVINFTWCE